MRRRPIRAAEHTTGTLWAAPHTSCVGPRPSERMRKRICDQAPRKAAAHAWERGAFVVTPAAPC